MKTRSIVMKLFLLTTGLFTITFLLFFLGQSLFLEKFYINKKVHNVQQAFETFVNDYSKSDQSFDSVKKLKQRFFDQTNAQLILLDRNGVIKDANNYYMEIQQTNGNKTFNIPLNNILKGEEYSSFMKLGIQDNEQIYVEGIRKKDTIIPILIKNSHGDVWTNDNIMDDLKESGIHWEDLKDDSASGNFVMRLNGQVTKQTLPSQADLQVVNNMDTLIQGVQRWELSVLLGDIDPKALTTFTFGDEKKGLNQLFVKPVVQKGETEFVFAMTSLQPVNEAMLVLKDYYVYALMIVFVVIILLSFYYSKIIAKPLIKVNQVTKRMANFDFSEKLSFSSNDEIGSLSESINTLSVNLKDRIEQLHIANQKLQEDVERERQLERTRKDFISGVSHELKTPLSVIRSFAEGIKDGVSKNTDYYTDVILEEADKMNTLIVEMLELAKLESGTYKLQMSPFAIDTLIHQVYTKLLFSIEEKQLQVHIQTESNLIVEANRNRIEQVVVNLLSNAIRYTPAEKHIIITASEENEQIKVSIRNTGEPIPEESLDKIWDRFYRLDASRSRHTGGTGLGLSIVKNILDLHGASYGVRNEEDGVVFCFFLPKANEME
ncbi:sensor histidine kinase [Ectobacillus panaciterrae]|uniref:sensor histidine kinase n=1 Tax=Ectobacillus panaciterrae TaxID=363872 RepID=UPI00042635D6|nr:HAMP domain-containing sensor histidine kinase [Ectobacillus panaciterrae]